MGVTNVCASTDQLLQTINISIVSLFNNTQPGFAIGTAEGTSTNVPFVEDFNNTPSLRVNFDAGETGLWTPIATSSKVFSGDLVGLYENYVTFKVWWSSEDETGLNVNAVLGIIGRSFIFFRIRKYIRKILSLHCFIE